MSRRTRSRRSHRATWRAFLPLAVLAVSSVTACRPPVAVDDGVRVHRGGDLVIANVQVMVRDSVAGDVMVAGSAVTFAGEAGGDVLSAGGNQRLGGTAMGSLRAAGGQVRVDMDVGRNATLAGGLVVLGPDSRVAGNAYLVGGSVLVRGSVDQLVRIGARDAVIDGTVAGDVLVESGTLRLGPGAAIEGDLRYRLGRGEELVLEEGAHVGGEILPLSTRPGAWARWALRVVRVLGFLLAGLVVVLLLPRLTLAAERRLGTRPLASLGLGIGLLVLVPLLLVVLAVTIVGLPLAGVVLAMAGVAAYLAPLIPALWLGRVLLSGSSRPERGELAMAFLAGGVILALLALVPYAGPVVRIIGTMIGLGALVIALWEGAVEVAG